MTRRHAATLASYAYLLLGGLSILLTAGMLLYEGGLVLLLVGLAVGPITWLVMPWYLWLVYGSTNLLLLNLALLGAVYLAAMLEPKEAG